MMRTWVLWTICIAVVLTVVAPTPIPWITRAVPLLYEHASVLWIASTVISMVGIGILLTNPVGSEWFPAGLLSGCAAISLLRLFVIPTDKSPLGFYGQFVLFITVITGLALVAPFFFPSVLRAFRWRVLLIVIVVCLMLMSYVLLYKCAAFGRGVI